MAVSAAKERPDSADRGSPLRARSGQLLAADRVVRSRLFGSRRVLAASYQKRARARSPGRDRSDDGAAASETSRWAAGLRPVRQCAPPASPRSGLLDPPLARRTNTSKHVVPGPAEAAIKTVASSLVVESSWPRPTRCCASRRRNPIGRDAPRRSRSRAWLVGPGVGFVSSRRIDRGRCSQSGCWSG